MDCALKVISSSSSSSSSSLCISPTNNSHSYKSSRVVFKPQSGNHSNDAVSRLCSPRTVSCAKRDLHRERSGLESLFCYDKAIPEEIIEKPVGLSLSEKNIGENPRCTGCQAKGAVLCTTCSGSGLYVDSILESQGIIVKVRCLGCGGTGNIMCSECGGRGHLGLT